MSEHLVGAVKSILKQAGITPEQNIVIGVSGGPDSLSLLHVMSGFMNSQCLWIAHLNHALRPEADEEADFVRQVASEKGLPFRGKKVDIASLVKAHGWSVEEAGRKARYQFMAEVAEEAGTEKVAAAHNADDQAETILHNILRGSGLRGLQGMKPVSPLPGSDRIELIRPLLRVSRTEIEAYCQVQQLQPMFDSTNNDPAYFRNRLRHELLPLLDDYNPGVKEHLQQLAAIVAADESYLEAQSDQAWQKILLEQEIDWLRIDLIQWRELPLSIRRRILRRVLVELRPTLTDISFRTIDLAHKVGMEKSTGAEAPLPGRIKMRLEYDHLLFIVDLEEIPINLPQLPQGELLELSIPGTIELENGWVITAKEVDVQLDAVRTNRDQWLAYFDVGRRDSLWVRSRRSGETIKPLGMNGRSASVQDIMVNRKLPAGVRDHWPIVATAEYPLWLVGQHVDERAKVTENTVHIIQLRCYQPVDSQKGND